MQQVPPVTAAEYVSTRRGRFCEKPVKRSGNTVYIRLLIFIMSVTWWIWEDGFCIIGHLLTKCAFTDGIAVHVLFPSASIVEEQHLHNNIYRKEGYHE